MPVAKLSREFYERFGDKLTDELVNCLNSIEASYRAELRDLFDAQFGRFEEKLERRLGETDARLGQFEARLGQFEEKLSRCGRRAPRGTGPPSHRGRQAGVRRSRIGLRTRPLHLPISPRGPPILRPAGSPSKLRMERRTLGGNVEARDSKRVGTYWAVDADVRMVEVWGPDDERPQIATDVLRWHVTPDPPVLEIVLADLFREVAD